MNNTETLKEELKDCPWCKGKPANEKSFVSKAEMQAQQEVEPSDNTPQVSVETTRGILKDCFEVANNVDTAAIGGVIDTYTTKIHKLYEGKK